jgi:hypothetical protein
VAASVIACVELGEFSIGSGTFTSFSLVSAFATARVVVSKPLPGPDKAKNVTGFAG